MMTRSTNAPFKGRIQKRKTSRLQIIKFSLQRTATFRTARRRSSLNPKVRSHNAASRAIIGVLYMSRVG